ncbi:glycosyl hydrolase family 28-related protein [Rubellimicrobium sp. CFH 75288]|uniref:glycosyl hydrolase family 28-related protein n=1 Tax=Rubellimicrobium sp. CFH 75288 TaxID=2697034 RepID=UPI0014129DAD|nr:glycosyl hydrolase family 28-related protein [Rubellimicrobium sp. CFH 75288]NAZ37489.1 right-handed parallel beta-helix repeat-containing protein [Rubellimicrobium sp. CFH 75288]
MNKAITDGLSLMPPPFAAGLGNWSAGDGTPGSDSYAGAGGGAFVPADADFGGCLELVKTASVQKIRFRGETPVLPGLYLRVSARVKCVAGPLPSVRVGGFPVGGPAGLPAAGPAVALPAHGRVVEVSAIIGTGTRGGVDLVWPRTVSHAHLGIDFTGPNGAVLRVENIRIEDVTAVFLRDMLALVDVRDFGARGDGVANDAPAFLAADAAAAGRTLLVPAGTYRLDADVTLTSPVRWEGTAISPGDRRLILRRNFNFNSYFDAYRHEETAFRKAYQALLNFADHESLDLCGRRIALSAPVDMAACEPTRRTFNIRRVLRNGQFQVADGAASAFEDSVVTAQATYSRSNPRQLTGVANAASIPVGSLVTGNGVGREVYVRAVDAAAGRVTLSAELFDAVGTGTFTFRRFRYLLDFSGYDDLSQMVIDDVEFFCAGQASALMLPPQGMVFHVRDCFFTRPKDRAITSIGSGCQGMLIDRCQFISNEASQPATGRTTLAFNANANDVKVRDNRVVMFRHFCVLGGTGNLVQGNHWFQGDQVPQGARLGGIVLTVPNPMTIIVGNYIDNNFIEWTNEHDATPAFDSQFSFGGLSVTGNIFTAIGAAPWSNFLVVKPFGPGHFIHGLTVTGNVFRLIGGTITRVERVDTTHADLDHSRMRNVVFEGNTFNGVAQEVRNPLSLVHNQATPARVWTCDTGTWLPFGGRVRAVESVTPQGRIVDAQGRVVHEMPWAETGQGAGGRSARLNFATPCRGSVRVVVRMDNPQ